MFKVFGINAVIGQWQTLLYEGSSVSQAKEVVKEQARFKPGAFCQFDLVRNDVFIARWGPAGDHFQFFGFKNTGV